MINYLFEIIIGIPPPEPDEERPNRKYNIIKTTTITIMEVVLLPPPPKAAITGSFPALMAPVLPAFNASCKSFKPAILLAPDCAFDVSERKLAAAEIPAVID